MDAIQDPQYKTSDGAALRIWRDTAQNKFQSEANGRPLFDEVIYCEAITPGSRDSTPVFELERVFCEEANLPPRRGAKYAEYKDFVEHFKKDEEHDSSLAGTPLSQWSEMTRTMVSTLKSASIYTVEALAALPDTKLTVVGPDGRTWREKAKAYVENAKNSAYATQLAAQLDKTQLDLTAANEREKALADRISQLEAASSNAAPKKAAPKAEAPQPPPAPVEQPNPAAPQPNAGESLVAASDQPMKSII